MIPKSLFISFISLQLPSSVSRFSRHDGQLIQAMPQPAMVPAAHTNVFPVRADYSSRRGQAHPTHGQSAKVNAVPMGSRDDVRKSGDDNPVVEVIFDKLASGDWDADKVVNGTVQFAADSALRIWNATSAFPNLKLKYGGSHALGNYPQGRAITVKLVDGVHRYVGGTFGWVVNGALADATWEVHSYAKGVWKGGTGDRFRGEWKSVGAGEVDEWRIVVTEGLETGLLLLLSLQYQEKPLGEVERVDL